MESLRSGHEGGSPGLVEITKQEISDGGAYTLANLPIDSYPDGEDPPYSEEELLDLIDHVARTFPFAQKDQITDYHLVDEFYRRAEAEIRRQRQSKVENI